MKVLRKTFGKIKVNRIRNGQIREFCDIEPIKGWMGGRKKEWDEGVTRIDAETFVKIARDKLPGR